MSGDILRIGILTISDRASKGEYEDRGGPAIIEWFRRALSTPWIEEKEIIPDEQPLIEDRLRDIVDKKGCQLIVTTGGTGPSARDVTPEATENVCDKILPGFGEMMRAESLKYVPTAILSRQTAGIYHKSLIINLPGKPSAIDDCLNAVFQAVPYCIDLLDGPYIETHTDIIKAFRPKHALLQKRKIIGD